MFHLLAVSSVQITDPSGSPTAFWLTCDFVSMACGCIVARFIFRGH